MNYRPIGFPRDLPLCSREFPICFSLRFGIRRDRRVDRCCRRRVGSEASISHQRPLCAASWQPPDKTITIILTITTDWPSRALFLMQCSITPTSAYHRVCFLCLSFKNCLTKTNVVREGVGGGRGVSHRRPQCGLLLVCTCSFMFYRSLVLLFLCSKKWKMESGKLTLTMPMTIDSRPGRSE